MNIELLIDFQTSYGYPVSVTAPTLAKQGNSILTSASFQNSLDYIFRGSAFGEIDEIKGISSCIITGSRSRNGTGIVESQFSKDYLQDESNKMPEDFTETDIDLETSMIVGPCYKTSKIDNILDELNIDVEISEEKTLDPPRTEISEEIEDLLDLQEIVYSQSNEQQNGDLEETYLQLDIPSAPGYLEEDLL